MHRILTIFDTIWATLRIPAVSSYSDLSQKSHRNNPGAANETGLLQLQVRYQDRLLTKRTWGKGKRTLTILLWIYSVSITIEKSGRHWPMCEYCSHEAAAACIDDDIKKVVERLLRDIWVHTQGQESVSGEWQETFSFSQYQIQNDSGQCPVVCKYAPRVILKPLPTARLWETRKFLHLVREFIKMSGLFCLFPFSERS